MQDRRFQGRVRQEMTVDPHLHDAVVPTMILQPIVENAYAHGLSRLTSAGVLSIDGNEVAKNSLDHGTPVTFPEDETFDVGLDTRTGVALVEYRYDSPFKFTGKIDKLTVEIK